MSEVAKNDDIDPRIVQLILRRIITAEKSNLQTKQKSDSQMIQELKNIIEEEVDAYKKN